LKLFSPNCNNSNKQCTLGNQRAQMEVYNRYNKAMYNTAYRIVKDRAEAEDVMQDSFLTAFTKLDSLKEKVTFGSWLKRIVIYDYEEISEIMNISYANCRTTISRAKESLRNKLQQTA